MCSEFNEEFLKFLRVYFVNYNMKEFDVGHLYIKLAQLRDPFLIICGQKIILCKLKIFVGQFILR